MALNDYDQIVHEYSGSERIHKQYSVLPTVLQLVDPQNDDIIIDLGCGDGFFAGPLARRSKLVIGIDNSVEQLNLARRKTRNPNVRFQLGDMLTYDLPQCDKICAPFVLNYSKSVEELQELLSRLYDCLLSSGRLVSVLEMPRGLESNRKYGQVSSPLEDKLANELVDGDKIKIELYEKGNSDTPICILHSHFYHCQTVEHALREIGFQQITWHQPIISQEGIQKYGEAFWSDFVENNELAYVTAKK